MRMVVEQSAHTQPIGRASSAFELNVRMLCIRTAKESAPTLKYKKVVSLC